MQYNSPDRTRAHLKTLTSLRDPTWLFPTHLSAFSFLYLTSLSLRHLKAPKYKKQTLIQVLSRGRGYACFLDDVDAMNVIPVGRVDMEAAYLRLLLEKFWEWEVKVEKDGVAALRGRDVGYRLRHLERGLVRMRNWNRGNVEGYWEKKKLAYAELDVRWFPLDYECVGDVQPCDFRFENGRPFKVLYPGEEDYNLGAGVEAEMDDGDVAQLTGHIWGLDIGGDDVEEGVMQGVWDEEGEAVSGSRDVVVLTSRPRDMTLDS